MKAPSVKRMQRYASVVIRWLVLGAITFSLTVAAGFYLVDDVLPKVYYARAVLEVPASDLVTPANSTPAPVAMQPEFVNMMMSPELLLAVIKDLGLERRWAERLNKPDGNELPDVDALTRMERLVKIEVKPGTNLVEITAASDVPEEAADIANGVANRYQSARNWQMHDPVLAEASRSYVRVVERASIPREPSKPDKKLDATITFVTACVLSLLVASFVEMILLFVRAGERTES